MRDEGRLVEAYYDRCAALAREADNKITPALNVQALALADEMRALPVAAGYPYDEPSDLPGILAARPVSTGAGQAPGTPPDPEKLRGAWLGRIAGCLLGKPVEGLHRDRLHPLLRATDNYPMHQYIYRRDFPDGLTDTLRLNPNRCWADTLNGTAPADDDTNYTVLGLKLLENYGPDFTPGDVLECWVSHLPLNATFTAERVAYRNAALCLNPPETATYQNPYREWIGAQIRADFYGYICPGDPERAAALAFRDACVSHIKNGIYGEMWVAAMLAAAAVTNDIPAILRAGLEQIPAKCRLRRDVEQVMGWHAAGLSGEEMIERIHAQYDEHDSHDWCHTLSNAMVVTMALLGGGGDFGRSICLAVQAAFDTDCNGATVGSILGLRGGAAAIPAVWTAPFPDGLDTSLTGCCRISLDELVERSLRAAGG